jgi:hypothetical protein
VVALNARLREAHGPRPRNQHVKFVRLRTTQTPDDQQSTRHNVARTLIRKQTLFLRRGLGDPLSSGPGAMTQIPPLMIGEGMLFCRSCVRLRVSSGSASDA